jgi:hypothetical protein
MNENIRKFIRDDVDVNSITDPIEDTRSESDKMDDLLQKSFISLSDNYPKPPSYLSIRDEFAGDIIPIFTPGNISAITGKAKAKKSFVQTMFTAATSMNGALNSRIIADLPEGKEMVILFDTEQSKYAVYRVTNRVKKLTNGNDENFVAFSLRGMDTDEIIALMNHVVDKFQNIGVIYIDQIADLTRSINDEKEAVKIVKWLEKMSNDYDLHICCVIHQNKGDGYATGWLGSQIMKKAETIISVEKEEQNKDISHVRPERSRGREFEPFSIIIDNEGMPKMIGTQETAQYNTEMSI